MMTPKQIQWRRRQVMENIQEKPHIIRYPEQFHRRAYHKGDMRCVNCKKWINPHNTEEAKEIVYGKRGYRIHNLKYCTVNSDHVAAFSTTPKFHGTRRKWLDAIKRY